MIRPMAAPVLGGLLVADEVIDVFLPVLYFAVQRRRRWLRLQAEPPADGTMDPRGGPAPPAGAMV